MDTPSQPTSQYVERSVRPPLSRHLLCTWTQRISKGESRYPHPVLPDACADVIWIGEAAPIVVGPATRSVVARLPADTLVVGARLRPGRVQALLDVPARVLRDTGVPLGDVWGSAAARLSERLAEAASVAHKLATLESALVQRWGDAEVQADRLVEAAVDRLVRAPGLRVGALGRALDISSRQLRRRFAAAVGYGPKTFQRIVRFQRLLALARRTAPDDLHLAQIALEAGYADQSHMTRDVRDLAGRVPTALLGRRDSTLTMSDSFKTALDDATYVEPHHRISNH